jgi:hypothetical protein
MALCTVDEVKAYAGIDTAKTETKELIQALINRMQDAFESYCDRKFDSQEHTEYQDGYGGQMLFTDQYPITSVSGIWESTSRTWSDVDAVDSNDYFISSHRTILRKSGFYLNYPKSIKVIYTAGYSTIPDDLKQACITEVTRHMDIRRSPSISSKVFQEATTSYTMDAFLPTTLMTLDMYRKRDLI